MPAEHQGAAEDEATGPQESGGRVRSSRQTAGWAPGVARVEAFDQLREGIGARREVTRDARPAGPRP